MAKLRNSETTPFIISLVVSFACIVDGKSIRKIARDRNISRNGCVYAYTYHYNKF